MSKGLELHYVEGRSLRKWDESVAEVSVWPVPSLITDEQEAVFLLERGNPLVTVDCSHTPFLLKLTRNPSFKVIKILRGSAGRILSVRGLLPAKKLSIRR